MKIGFCSVTFRSKSIEEIIEIAENADLNYIERGSDVHIPKGDYDKARFVGNLCQ